MSTFLNNRYKLIRQIGEGGYGVVWLANDITNNTEVAVKIYKDSIPCDMVERARKEYAIGMSLYHPNILPSYDFNHHEGFLFIVMPYCSFGSIAKSVKIPEHTLWRIIKDIACGLEYLHNCGIIHLDIKPSNILLDSRGRYVISDFGLSHSAASLIYSYNKAITIGGIAYMSPERFAFNKKIDTSSDIWSLGVAIYELVTGELPFRGGGQQQLSDCIFKLQCDKCSKRLSKLIDACINPCPQIRPSATEIIALADSMILGNEAECDELCTDGLESLGALNFLTLDGTLACSFYNSYNNSVLSAMKRYKIVKSAKESLYGIVDDKGIIIVDFLYDEISNFRESCWPGPGPGRPRDEFFIGAFFRQGNDAGYFIIQDDGNIAEYKRCLYEEFVRLCQLT